MLHAILLNKAGRSLGSNEVNWRQLFSASEDSLTSTIFGNLFYLPVELFWHILNKSSYEKNIIADNPKIMSFEFWPRWSAIGSLSNESVEPDLFIRTKNLDIIIEAKKYDDSATPQSHIQWETEIKGYLNEFREESKDVILIAIGGIDNKSKETINLEDRIVPVFKCRWINIFLEIKQIINDLDKSKGIHNSIDSSLIILNDIIKGFNIHGYFAGSWLQDGDINKLIQLKSSTLSPFFTFK